MKKVGKVTENEKEVINSLYERLNGLHELQITLDECPLDKDKRDTLYSKMLTDMEHAKTKYDKWWKDMKSKYSWEGTINGKWSINFETNEVFLACNNNCNK